MDIRRDRAESALIESVERFKKFGMKAKAVLLHFAEHHVQSFGSDLHNFAHQTAVQLFEGTDTELFLLADGDVLLLTQNAIYEEKMPEYLEELLDAISFVAAEGDAGENELYDVFMIPADCEKLIQLMRAKIESDKSGGGGQGVPEYAFEIARHNRYEREVQEIMIVEDQAFSRQLLKANIPPAFVTTAFDNGHDAIHYYKLNAPDLVFLDVNMPGKNGWEVLEEISQTDPESFVIMTTVCNHEDDVERAIRMGVKGYIVKPFTPEKVKDFVYKCARYRGTLKKKYMGASG